MVDGFFIFIQKLKSWALLKKVYKLYLSCFHVTQTSIESVQNRTSFYNTSFLVENSKQCELWMDWRLVKWSYLLVFVSYYYLIYETRFGTSWWSTTSITCIGPCWLRKAEMTKEKSQENGTMRFGWFLWKVILLNFVLGWNSCTTFY